MTPQSPFVTFEEVTNTPGPTQGLTKRQVKFDIRAQPPRLPGSVDHRGRIVIRRDEWNEFCAGTWAPEQSDEPEVRKPIGIHSFGKAS